MAIPVVDKGLQVKTTDRDDEGRPLEPEQRPAQQDMEFAPSIFTTTGEVITKQFVNTPTIAVNRTAGDFAQQFKNKCALCKHFDYEGFQKFAKDLTTQPREPEAFAVWQQVQSVFLGQDFDVRQFGICRAQTDICGRATSMHVDEGCPVGKKGPLGEDLSNLFQAKDRAAERAGTANYDKILKTAEGPNNSLRRLRKKLVMKF